jgi:2-haloacid dehalogenase
VLDLDRFRALTFDCYGTLIDWESGILAAVKPVLAAHGREASDEEILRLYAGLESRIEQEEFRAYRSVLRGVMDGFGERLGFEPDEAERSALGDSLGRWPPFPDTVDALRALKSRFRLGILSNVDDDLFAMTARRLGVAFDWVVTAGQVGAYKPSRRMFEAALARIDLPGEAILHVAQSLHHDVGPAREIGLATVWVHRRQGKSGSGATPEARARPDLELPDLASLVSAMGLDGTTV